MPLPLRRHVDLGRRSELTGLRDLGLTASKLRARASGRSSACLQSNADSPKPAPNPNRAIAVRVTSIDSPPGSSTPVWLYWEDLPGRTRAPYLDLCLDTIRRHSPVEPTVVDYHTAFEYVDLDPDRWESLRRPNFRSDYLRARLLHRHGGMWIDIDTIAVAPLERLLTALTAHHVVAFGQELGRVYPTIMAARPGSALLETWMRRQDEVLDAGIREYGGLGAGLLSGMTGAIGNWALHEVAPVLWWEWRRLLSYTEAPARTLSQRPTTVCLWNKAMGPTLQGVSRGQLIAGQSLLSRLLRVGLGLSTETDERNVLTALWPANALRFSRAGRAVEGRLRGERGRNLEPFEV